MWSDFPTDPQAVASVQLRGWKTEVGAERSKNFASQLHR